MADKHIAVSGCGDCPTQDRTLEEGWWCGIVSHVLLSESGTAPDNCPLRKGRVILFLNEKRED